MAFYNPVNLNIEGIPSIIYFDNKVEQVLSRTEEAVIDHISGLPTQQDKPFDIDYRIIFLWKDGYDLMTDMWNYTALGIWDSGPLANPIIFRREEITDAFGVASGNTLIVLGLEETHRRKVDNLQEYLTGPRAELPEELDLLLNKDFY
jgi:hypothetical protein